MKISKKIVLASFVTISVLVGAVYAAAFLTQTFPSVKIPPVPPPTITSPCSDGTTGSGSLVLESTPTADTGQLVFDCGTTGPNPLDTVPAFVVTRSPGASAVTATPTFSIPITGSGTATLLVEVHNSGCGNGAPLTSGVAVQLTAFTYDYCVSYSGFDGPGGSIDPFTVTWT